MKKATRVLSLTMAAAMAAGVLGGCSSQRTGRHSQHGRYFQCRFHHSIQRGQR